MFEGDSADTHAGKFPLVSMGGWTEGLACADPGARTPIVASWNFPLFPARPPVEETSSFLKSLLASHGPNYQEKLFGPKARNNL